MAVNVGVLLLASQKIDGLRLDIEDNIGESIHLHYKNMRFDFTVHDFLIFSDGCKKAQTQLVEHIAKKDLSREKNTEVGIDATFAKSCKVNGLKFKEIITVYLNDIFCTNFIDGQYHFRNISDSIIFTALSNKDKELYDNYIDTLGKAKNAKPNYSWEKFMELMNSIKSLGYDERCLIATKDVTGGNETRHIIDGQHRACILYYLYKDIKIKAAHFIKETEI